MKEGVKECGRSRAVDSFATFRNTDSIELRLLNRKMQLWYYRGHAFRKSSECNSKTTSLVWEIVHVTDDARDLKFIPQGSLQTYEYINN